MSNKNKWIKVRFKDFVQNVTDRIEKPSESGLKYYVGLEHLDTDNIRIKRYGSPEEVNATKFIAKKGDIIFGKRRAYLRKVAITEKDAVVSAHSMVLRPKGELIHKDFLPCFLQSSTFWKIAHSISEGSLSPTIKWKTLSKQEFLIPPIKEQERIAKILWSIETAIENTEKLIEIDEKLKNGLLNELLTKGTGHKKFKKTYIGDIPEEWDLVELGKMIKPNFGIRITQKKDRGVKYPVYGGGGISFYTDTTNRKDEFVVSRFAMGEECARFVSGEFYLLDSGFSIETISNTPKEYLGIFLIINQHKIYSCGRGPAQKNLDIQSFLKIPFPKPTIKDAMKTINIYNHFISAIDNLNENKEKLQNLKKKLTNELLSGKLRLK